MTHPEKKFRHNTLLVLVLAGIWFINACGMADSSSSQLPTPDPVTIINACIKEDYNPMSKTDLCTIYDQHLPGVYVQKFNADEQPTEDWTDQNGQLIIYYSDFAGFTIFGLTDKSPYICSNTYLAFAEESPDSPLVTEISFIGVDCVTR